MIRQNNSNERVIGCLQQPLSISGVNERVTINENRSTVNINGVNNKVIVGINRGKIHLNGMGNTV